MAIERLLERVDPFHSLPTSRDEHERSASCGASGGMQFSVRQPADSVTELADVVRRSLAARTRDQYLIEDLTQDTLVRLAGVDHQLSPDEQKAYAIVTARNLLTSHARRRAIRQRHIHRLVDVSSPAGPEQRILDREETDALMAALERLDPSDVQLLLRHESDGTELATLAEEANVTPGAMAMRMARARAHLRLEFLLAFRRVTLPTDRCQAVLLALSNGDRRRQAMLDAPAHLASCPTCATLAEPLTRRNRRVFAWFLLPLTEGIRRAWRRLTSRSMYRAAAVTMAGVAFTLLVAPEPPIGVPPPATTESDPSGTRRSPRTSTGTPGEPTPDITAPSSPTSTATTAPATPATLDAATTPGSPAPCLLTTPVEQLDPATEALCSIATTIVGAVDEPVDAVPAPTLPPAPTVASGQLGPVDSLLNAGP